MLFNFKLFYILVLDDSAAEEEYDAASDRVRRNKVGAMHFVFYWSYRSVQTSSDLIG